MGTSRNKNSPHPDTASSLLSLDPFYSYVGLSTKISRTHKEKRDSLVVNSKILLENLWEQQIDVAETMCRQKGNYDPLLVTLQRNNHAINSRERQTAHQ